MEKDIENLARGEVKSVKLGYIAPGGDWAVLVEGCYSHRSQCEMENQFQWVKSIIPWTHYTGTEVCVHSGWGE